MTWPRDGVDILKCTGVDGLSQASDVAGGKSKRTNQNLKGQQFSTSLHSVNVLALPEASHRTQRDERPISGLLRICNNF